MLEKVKVEFPEIFTKKGEVRKVAPKRYECRCGHSFNKTKKIDFGGISFGIPTCIMCGQRAKKSTSYNVWKRMINNQIEQEDFILESIKNRGAIPMDDLKQLIENQFGITEHNALHFLVYFGYLNVNEKKRDELGVIEYSLNPRKNPSSRYEL